MTSEKRKKGKEKTKKRKRMGGGGGRRRRICLLPPGTHRGVGALIKGEEESVLREMGELLSLENRERSVDINSSDLTGSYMLIFWSLY